MRRSNRAQRLQEAPVTVLNQSVYTEAAFQLRIMREDHYSVLGEVQIRLQGVSACFHSGFEGGKCILRMVEFVASVRDYLRSAFLGGGEAF